MKEKKVMMLFTTAIMTMAMTVPVFATENGNDEGIIDTPDIISEEYGENDETIEESLLEENNIPDPAENLPDITIPDSVREQMMMTRNGDGNTPTTIPGTWIQASDGRWWYKHTDGSYSKNVWEYINGSWYHFDDAGWMQTGWLNDGNKWYYLNASGVMATGWIQVDGKWYYMTASGAMSVGWTAVGGNWYYMDSSGAMITGTRVIDGVTYTFASSGELISDNAPTNKGKEIVDYAVQFVGNPYVYGGTSLTNGADCSGFVQSIFKHFGISLPRSTNDQVKSGTSVSTSQLKPVDLVFYYDGPGHVAIYIGNSQVVHALNSRTGIVITSIDWCGTPVACRRTW